MDSYFSAPTAVADAENKNPRLADIRTCSECGLSRVEFVGCHACPGYWSGAKVGILFVGMSPGADEDKLGRPFVGKAGRLLLRLAAEEDVLSQSIGLTNMVRCHTPENRPPTGVEVATCRHWLEAEVKAANPKAVVLLGNSAIPLAFPGKTVGGVAASARSLNGRVWIACYHPAALLHQRNPAIEASIRASLKLAKEVTQ